MRKFAQTVDFRVPGRISAFYLVDGKDSRFGVVSVEMLMESHDDSGDFFTGVVVDIARGEAVIVVGMSLGLVDARNLAADFVDNHEADTEHEQGCENDAHCHGCHAKAVAVHFGKLLDFVIGVLDYVCARRGDVFFAACAHFPFAIAVGIAGVRGVCSTFT